MTDKYVLIAAIYFGCVAIFALVHMVQITKMDTNPTYKYMRVAGPVIYFVSIMAFLLGMFAVYKDPDYIVHILYGTVMLVCLPAVLFTVGVNSIIAGNV